MFLFSLCLILDEEAADMIDADGIKKMNRLSKMRCITYFYAFLWAFGRGNEWPVILVYLVLHCKYIYLYPDTWAALRGVYECCLFCGCAEWMWRYCHVYCFLYCFEPCRVLTRFLLCQFYLNRVYALKLYLVRWKVERESQLSAMNWGKGHFRQTPINSINKSMGGGGICSIWSPPDLSSCSVRL